ncbi:MAG TPA: DNRLRE domain-containing protein, partial [Micromonosporaceae bacterium]|nr:DNRLRE domain-containing protein [Micromonosporaceae bacterium]
MSIASAEQRVSAIREVGKGQGFVVGRSVERPEGRTARTTEFANPDGSKTARIYDGTAFVRDAAGRFRPYDNSLSAGGDGRLVPAAAAPVSLAPRADDAQVASLALGDGVSVGFAVDGAAPAGGLVKGATVTYPGVRAQADLRLTATDVGVKEEIVLRSAAAPSSWLFPLVLQGVKPALEEASGSVVFTDGAGAVRAAVPPGFMVDANVHPRRGTGERSNSVHYAVVPHGGGWALRVDLDEAWLRDPARVFPVVVDPTFTDNSESDDTFVSKRDHANRNNSSEGDLLAGTYNGGTERAASYLHFSNLKTSLPNRYVLDARLNLYNFWSYSCRARAVNVYEVTKAWSGSTTKTWAGPSFDSAHRLATGSFAFGYDSCPSGGWGSFQLPALRVRGWLHGDPFHGITVRASETDSFAWKRFGSANFANASGRPYIDVSYSDQGAQYSLVSSSFNPPVTAASAGRIPVRVYNWGWHTWTPSNGYRLTYKILTPGGSLVRSGPLYTMPRNVAPHQSVDISVQVEALALGNYILRFDMVNPSGQSFQSTYGVPFGQANFSVVNGGPTIGDGGVFPAHNGFTDSLTPTLWADYVDPDNTPAGGRRLRFRVCKGTPAAPGACQSSGATTWLTSTTWRVPAGLLEWHEPAHWYVRLSDTQAQTAELGPYVFTPTVPQPEITSHLATAPAGADVPGLNPYAGNYSTTVTDASVAVSGPDLALTRTYNSQDPRADGAFGAGWASPIDQRIAADTDGSGNVVLTLPTGGQLRFGRNADGGYAPPEGTNLTLIATGTPTVWTVRDSSGHRRLFTADGRLSSVVDPDGRIQTYAYDGGGKLATITDVASGRKLHLTWTGGHVTRVATDPPVTGATAPAWTYGYDGDRLTQVCTPLSAQSCTGYAYTGSSHYRSVVTDDNPAGYWPLGEPTDTADAVNVVATKAGERQGSYEGVTSGVPGALAGSPDTAADFGASPTSAVTLPKNLADTSIGLAVELWFKAAAGENGVLFGMQNDDLTSLASATQWTPVLYVGTDGRLHGRTWTEPASTQMLSPGRVDDGSWHHVVLSGAGDAQQLYLD